MVTRSPLVIRYFHDDVQAAVVYDRASVALHGAAAPTNFEVAYYTGENEPQTHVVHPYHVFSFREHTAIT